MQGLDFIFGKYLRAMLYENGTNDIWIKSFSPDTSSP
jgi:hypothetical protein